MEKPYLRTRQGTKFSWPRFGLMEREQQYDWVLLAAVMLFSMAVAGVFALFESTPDVATTKPPTYLASQEQVRVIVPFAPNTIPGER